MEPSSIGRINALALALLLLASACGGTTANSGTDQSATTVTSTPITVEVECDSDVPDLPFEDNPDPAQCGIPVQWGEASNDAWLSGEWEGRLIQPEVFLYDSHLRVHVTGVAAHGTAVKIVLFQENPVLDYYFVQVPGTPVIEGWVPEPFLAFDPVA